MIGNLHMKLILAFFQVRQPDHLNGRIHIKTCHGSVRFLSVQPDTAGLHIFQRQPNLRPDAGCHLIIQIHSVFFLLRHMIRLIHPSFPFHKSQLRTDSVVQPENFLLFLYPSAVQAPGRIIQKHRIWLHSPKTLCFRKPEHRIPDFPFFR